MKKLTFINTKEEVVLKVTKRIIEKLIKYSVGMENSIQISVGIASGSGVEQLERVMELADLRMYEQKRSKRQVFVRRK